MATVDRTVQIYDVSMWQATRPAPAPLTPLSNHLPVFQRIARLPARTPGRGRYLRLQDGNDLYVTAAVHGTKIHGEFAYKRLVGIPPVEDAGHLSALVLAAGKGLAEIRHYVYDTSRHLLGIEVNGRSAGISRLGDYIESQCASLVSRVEFSFRLDQDLTDLLERVDRIRGATLTVLRDRSRDLESLDPNLRRGVRALGSAGDGLEITVAWEVGTRRRDAEIHVPWIARLPAFLGGAGRDALTEARIRAHDPLFNRVREIDLLETRLQGRKTVALLDDANSVDSASMFRAIGEVLDELSPPQ